MGDANPICTLGDYSKPSHEGYRNTIELPMGNNVLKRLPAGSITTWEDLTNHFLAQFFPPGRTAKLHNDILMFQQHHGESLSEAWTHFKDLLQKVPHHDIDLLLQNDPRDFANPVKAIFLPQDVPSTSDRLLFKVENQVQCLMEAHLALMKPTQVNKITTSFEICSGPHDTQYCMKDLEQSFVEYASSRTDEAGVKKIYDSHKEEPKAGGLEVDYFDTFPTQSEFAYHKYLICGPIPSIFLRNPIITNISYVALSPQNIMTRMMYNWIMKGKLDPREILDRGVSNFKGRIKGMHVFVGNFTYVTDFMIVEDISSIIDPRLSQVVLGKPFVDTSNMTHDPPEGVVRFTNGTEYVTGMDDEGEVT
ncbi:MAK10-like protein [Tanacetum coccineum]|uniref:MAK10-like protein n=1 Tax=Tanacetum coccineum TaxID=301880 RepID=A0ABQ5CNK9_9ASTR